MVDHWSRTLPPRSCSARAAHLLPPTYPTRLDPGAMKATARRDRAARQTAEGGNAVEVCVGGGRGAAGRSHYLGDALDEGARVRWAREAEELASATEGRKGEGREGGGGGSGEEECEQAARTTMRQCASNAARVGHERMCCASVPSLPTLSRK